MNLKEYYHTTNGRRLADEREVTSPKNRNGSRLRDRSKRCQLSVPCLRCATPLNLRTLKMNLKMYITVFFRNLIVGFVPTVLTRCHLTDFFMPKIRRLKFVKSPHCKQSLPDETIFFPFIVTFGVTG